MRGVFPVRGNGRFSKARGTMWPIPDSKNPLSTDRSDLEGLGFATDMGR